MDLTLVRLSGSSDLPLLVVGSSLGTSVTTLWKRCADLLGDRFHVVGWEMPGHGHGRPTIESFTIADLAVGVLAAVGRLGVSSFAYAGDSAGGAVGLQLALDAPGQVRAAALLSTAARIGEPRAWRERAATVRAAGTSVMVSGSARRWFAPGFLEREPETADALLGALQEVDRESYALLCEALADFDLRTRLPSVQVPVLGIGGSDDVATPAAELRVEVSQVRAGRFVELDNVAHLPPVEAPRAVSSLLLDFFTGQAESLGGGMVDPRGGTRQ